MNEWMKPNNVDVASSSGDHQKYVALPARMSKSKGVGEKRKRNS